MAGVVEEQAKCPPDSRGAWDALLELLASDDKLSPKQRGQSDLNAIFQEERRPVLPAPLNTTYGHSRIPN
jgi:hypothetical protein